MNNVAMMSVEDRKFIFDSTALKLKMHPAIIEKDFWICYILDYLFNESQYKNHFTFKGGTSLSKAYSVITRMSEDIDLILDWEVLGVERSEPFLDRSKRQQEILNAKLNNLAQEFIANELKLDLVNGLANISGLNVEVIKEEQLINIYYPKIYDTGVAGILPCVRLEIGPLAAWSPGSIVEVKPYIDGIIPNLHIEGTKVRTVTIARTFWEKITILHQEANRPNNKAIPSRYSRHYYDVYQIYTSKYIDKILSDRELLKTVTKFKIKFYNSGWAKFNDVLEGNLKIVPPDYRIKELENDYDSMREMIVGEPPEFSIILNKLKELESILNKK